MIVTAVHIPVGSWSVSRSVLSVRYARILQRQLAGASVQHVVHPSDVHSASGDDTHFVRPHLLHGGEEVQNQLFVVWSVSCHPVFRR